MATWNGWEVLSEILTLYVRSRETSNGLEQPLMVTRQDQEDESGSIYSSYLG